VPLLSIDGWFYVIYLVTFLSQWIHWRASIWNVYRACNTLLCLYLCVRARVCVCVQTTVCCTEMNEKRECCFNKIVIEMTSYCGTVVVECVRNLRKHKYIMWFAKQSQMYCGTAGEVSYNKKGPEPDCTVTSYCCLPSRSGVSGPDLYTAGHSSQYLAVSRDEGVDPSD
jgi:hypothetical protein